MRQSLTVLLCVMTICVLHVRLSAQITDVTSVQSPPISGAGHGYVQMLNETVNPSNGALSIRINVPVPAGRHLTVPFGFGYDSNTSNFISAQGYAGSNSYLSAGGWSYLVPHLDYQHKDVSYYEQWLNGAPVGSTKYPCDLYNDHIFTDPQGGTHALYLAMFANVSGCNQYLAGFNPTNVTTGTDGKVTATVNGTGQWPPVTVSDASGTVYYFSGPWHNAGTSGYSSLPAWIENSNGDKVTITDSGSGVFTMVDTLGRNAVASSGFGTTGNTVTVSGLSGSYKVTWGTASSTWVPTWRTTTDCTGSACGSCLPVQQGSPATIPVISTITLPDNRSYQFQYDSTYGVINKIIYPTGGYVRYDWQVNPLSDAIDFYLDNNSAQTTNFNCHERFDTLAVHHRYVSADGNSAHEYEQQTFQIPATQWAFPNSGLPGYGVWNGKTTTIVTSDTLRGTSTQTAYSYIPLNLVPNPYDGAWRFVFNGNCQSSCNTDGIVWSPTTYRQYPVEQITKFEDGSGNVLKTVTQSFIDQYRMNCAVTSVTDVAPAAISGTFYTWGPGDQLTDKKEYDFGIISDPTTCETDTVPSATPTRETAVIYASFATTVAGGSILDRPSTVKVYGNGALAAETDYSYDGYGAGLTSVASPTGHDPTYSTTYTDRGNATTETRKCFVGATACTNGIYGYQFDQTGQITSVTDPLGNATQYKYSDSYTVLSGGSNVSYTPSGNTNAFVTTITNPLSQAYTFTYDYNSSQVTASKDPNDINAGRAGRTYIYADSFARPTVKSLPDGGQTEYVYNDAVPSTTICELINGTAGVPCSATAPASGWKTTLVTMDGLGRVVQKALVSDPGGATYTGTVYDGVGHVFEITNPYRATNDPTYGVTTTIYDALDRACLVVPSDGTLPSGSTCPASRPSGDVLTVYDQRNGNSSGICTTVTDEAGVSRQSCADALGRMTGVGEDPSGLNYETDYVYDALNDLLSVTQKGGSTNSSQWRPRSFSYDSLSRLTSATNPESGTIGYTYDANGNVTTKIAPANQTSGTITTTYKYDALNRLTSKTYSGDAAATPSSCYQYDVSSTTNGIGRLANAWTQSASQGSCPKLLPASGVVTKRSILSYDALGRITSEQQCTPFNCVSTTPYALSFSYDPAGNLSKYTNGIGTTPGATANPLAFTHCFDAAGRLQTTMSNWNDATHPTSLFSAQMSQSSTCSGSSGPTVSTAPYSPAGALQNAFYGTGLGLTRTYDNRLRITGEADTAGH